VIGAFASYLAWMWLLRHYPATQMSSFTFLTPVFALVFGVLLLHEPLTAQLVLALLGVAAGIVLVNRVSQAQAAGGSAKADILALMGSLCGEPIAFDDEVARSEADTGFRNFALANFMKSFGKLDNDVATVLDTYFHQCALRMSCRQLARAAAFLCRDGAHPIDGEPEITGERQTRRINALMLTCGTYDAAGDVAFSIGLPCKSGVGGGIVAVVPDKLTLCVWSPALDATGNSLLGMKALELFVARTGLSVF
jgi:glutaminase